MKKLLVVGFVFLWGGSLFSQEAESTGSYSSHSSSEIGINKHDRDPLCEVYALSNSTVEKSCITDSDLKTSIPEGRKKSEKHDVSYENHFIKNDVVTLKSGNVIQTVKKSFLVIKGLREKTIKLEVQNRKGNVISLRKYIAGGLSSFTNFSSGFYLVNANGNGKRHYLRKLRVR